MSGGIDPILLEILWRRLISIVDEADGAPLSSGLPATAQVAHVERRRRVVSCDAVLRDEGDHRRFGRRAEGRVVPHTQTDREVQFAAFAVQHLRLPQRIAHAFVRRFFSYLRETELAFGDAAALAADGVEP